VIRRGAVVVLLLALVACGDDGEGRAGADPVVEVTAAPVASAATAVGEACLEPAERAKAVQFRSRNGAELTAVIFGAGRAAVVLAHQSASSLCEWVPYARELAGLGYQALALDLNGYGGSELSAGSPADARYDLDVAAAVGVLRGRGAENVVLIGASLGGTAVVTAAAEISPPVAGVVDLAGPAVTSGMDAGEAARRLTVPALYVSAEHDPFSEDIRKVHAATREQYRTLALFPGQGHGVALLNPELQPDVERVRTLLATFLRDRTTGTP